MNIPQKYHNVLQHFTSIDRKAFMDKLLAECKIIGYDQEQRKNFVKTYIIYPMERALRHKDGIAYLEEYGGNYVQVSTRDGEDPIDIIPETMKLFQLYYAAIRVRNETVIDNGSLFHLKFKFVTFDLNSTLSKNRIAELITKSLQVADHIAFKECNFERDFNIQWYYYYHFYNCFVDVQIDGIPLAAKIHNYTHNRDFIPALSPPTHTKCDPQYVDL